MPDPDLLIRTAGEMRVSNFLLWQISYAEIWVTERTGPTSTSALHAALRGYAARDRRFGGLMWPDLSGSPLSTRRISLAIAVGLLFCGRALGGSREG